ncbi:MAG: serine/threonine-protein kinase [Bacteroidota bacterium]
MHGRFEPGTRLGSRYRVVGLLGRGGMGEVYRADDLELNHSVALKFLPERVARNPADLARLRQEVRVARQIAHPNVCRTYDIAEADGQVFVVMEYVDGEDLASVLRRLGRPTPDKGLEIARQLCLGLGAAHENGVLHRDLKPANIMIDGRGRVRITDFGLAGTPEEIAAEGGIAGTPGYMAPEQRQSGTATPQSDIYALGLVLYELFTGKRATDMIPAPSPSSRPGSDSSVRTPSSLVGDIDPVVERVILRCLERDPARRPQSAYAVYGALPGGDPLAAAVAAGETPSPELVANAGVEGSVRPLWAGLVVALTIAGFVAAAWVQNPLYKGFGLEPRVLSARADEILTQVTGKDHPRHTADGMRYAPPDTSRAARAVTPPRQYWRRWSPRPLDPLRFHSPLADLEDPIQAIPGSATMLLDMRGSLVALSAVPEEQRDTTAARRPAPWESVLRASGRDATAPAAPVPAGFVPYADSAMAWQLAPDTVLAAASLRNQIVRVDTFARGRALGSLAISTTDDPPGPALWIYIFLVTLIPMVGSILLAKRNLESSRTDMRGALVVGISTFAAYMLAHLFAMNVGEVGLFHVLDLLSDDKPIGHALLHGVTMFFFYLAIEPYVRRLWPSALVSWARLVAGKTRDPIIGRDVLAGAVVGTVFVVLRLSGQAIARGLGQGAPPTIPPVALTVLVNAPTILTAVFFFIAISLLETTSVFMLLVLFRFVLRKTWAAAIPVVLVITLSSIDFSSKSPGPEIAMALLGNALAVVLALRFGYVAVLVASLLYSLGGALVWTGQFSSWIGPPAMFSWALLGLVLAYGFLTAVKGRTLFSDPLSDPAVRPKKG